MFNIFNIFEICWSCLDDNDKKFIDDDLYTINSNNLEIGLPDIF